MLAHESWCPTLCILWFCLLVVVAPVAAEQWWTMETENFLIHYETKNRVLAGEVAQIAERVYPVITERYRHRPQGPVHVVLADTGDLPGGMAVTNYFNLIVLQTAPAVHYAHLVGIESSSDWMELVFIHEFTHIVHLDMADGVHRALRSVLGRVPLLATPNYGQGLAWIEGLAIYEEGLLATGRGHSTFLDMFLRAAVVGDQLLTLDQVLGYYDVGVWDPGGGAYTYGYSLAAFLTELQGETALPRLAHAASRSLVAGPNAGMQSVAGMDIRQFYSTWRQEMESRYLLQLQDIQGRGVTPVYPVNSQSWFAVHPQYSPDGASLAYEAALGTVGRSLRIIDRNTGKDVAAASGAYGGFAWTPDSEHIIYPAVVSCAEGRQLDLFALQTKTGTVHRLTNGLRGHSPAISPDGRWIAVVQTDGAVSTSHLLVAPLEYSGGQIYIGPFQPWFSGGRDMAPVSAAWLPAQEKLVVAMTMPNGSKGLHIVCKDQEATPLLLHHGHLANPRFSFDGRYLLFESDVVGVTNIYAYDWQEEYVLQVTNTSSGVFFPALCPSGQELAVSEYTVEGYRIVTMPFTGLVSPGPPFTGSHWQRGGPARSYGLPPADAATIPSKERPYNPVPYLMPTWWLPLPELDEQGWSLSMITAMEDARRRHSYSLQVGYNFVHSQLRYTLSYNWQQDIWQGLGWQAGMTWRQTGPLAFSVQHRWNTGLHWAEPATHQLYARIQTGNQLQDIQMNSGWRYTTATGSDRTLRGRNIQLDLGGKLASMEDMVLWARWSEWLRLRQGGSIRTTIEAGYTAGSNEIGLAGDGQRFQIHGLRATDIDNRGSTALKLSMDGQIRVGNIYRGIGLLPVFFEHVTVAPFLQVGYLPGWDQYAVSVGASVSLATSLGYGAIDVAPWIGGALLWVSETDSPMFRLIWGATF